MNKALAFYFVMIGVVDLFGAVSDWTTYRGRGYAAISVVVWFALAAGLYGRYRLARMAGIGICATAGAAAVIFWVASGCQHHLLLGAAFLLGLPLAGLLHPRARTKFARRMRASPRTTGSKNTE